MSDAPIVIAIDGPSASGKSTVARCVAKAIGFVYVDTGAMYRMVSWLALQKQVALNDDAAILSLVEATKIEFKLCEGCVQMWVNGYYPQKEIRTAEVSAAVPEVAKLRKLRAWVVEHQRAMTQFGSLVMEGRDIGSVVFPKTPHKFYLDASPEVRTQRRHVKDGVKELLAVRDQHDSSRAVSPLKIADGAKVIDSSSLTVEQVVEVILAKVKGKLA